jgi:glycosyltransferase involved in cell wall biosynthesis
MTGSRNAVLDSAPSVMRERPFRHVGINAVFLRPMMAGIETYVRRLTPELAALAPDARFTLFVSRAGMAQLEAEPWVGRVELATHPLLGIRYLQAASEMTLLAHLARRRGVDVLHSVALTGPLASRPVHVVTLGDVTWLRQPEAVDRVTGWTWRTFVPRIARRARRVLTYSQASRRDIVDFLSIPEERIDVVPLGPGFAAASRPTDEAALRADLELGEGPVVLTASAKRPTKNLPRLIEATRTVIARVPDATLVMPGAHTPHEAELKAVASRLGIAQRTRFPGYLDPADLEGLYRCASCFVFPSMYEGFGLPVLEAMRRDVPVACSRASSLPEVAGEAARYFDPTRPEEIAAAVLDVLLDADLRRRLVDAGRRRQGAFTWRATAEGTLESFERAWAATTLRRHP